MLGKAKPASSIHPAHEGAILDPRLLVQFLKAQSTLDVVDAGLIGFEKLTLTNAADIDLESRQKLLEVFADWVAHIDPVLQSQYKVWVLPLTTAGARAAQVAMSLSLELARGYARALLQHSPKRSLFGTHHRHLALAEQAVEALREVQRICYATYSPIDQEVWAEINRIYTEAVRQQWLKPGKSDSSGLGLSFKKAQLLALCNPYRFTPAEIDAVHHLLDRHAKFAALRPIAPDDDNKPFFWVRLNSGMPAVHATQFPMDADPSRDLELDTSGVIRSLRDDQEKNRLGNDLMGAALVPRLLESWSATPSRLWERSSTQSLSKLCVGIPSIAYQMNASSHYQATLDKKPPQRWTLVNQSLYGCGLVQTDQGEGIRNGALVAIQPESKTTWQIGVIRWIISLEFSSCQIGVEYLTDQATVCFVTVGDESVPSPALLMLNETEDMEIIIGPAGSYASGRPLMLDGADGYRQVRGRELLENGSGFDLFEIADDVSGR